MSSTILNLSARSPIDGTEAVVLATSGSNWKAVTGSNTFVFGGIAGGTAASSILTLESTTGTGTTDSIKFLTGTQSERMRVTTGGLITIGGVSSQDSGAQLQLVGGTGTTAGANGPVIDIIANNTSQSPPILQMFYSNAAGVGANGAVPSGAVIGEISFCPNDGSATQFGAAMIQGVADALATAGNAPTRLSFFTGSTGPGTENFRVDHTGATYLIGTTTTASAANAFINNASTPVNSILRSTSSRRYKTKERKIPQQRIDAIRNLQPVEFTSLAAADDKNMRFVGYVAEDVAEIDPGLVNLDEHGRPDGVQYDRVLLLKIAALEMQIKELENELSKRKGK